MIEVCMPPRPPKQLNRIQKAMLKVLSDGLPHHKKELHACLDDELGHWNNIIPHISNIRKHLHLKGQYIVCEYFKRSIHYRHVKLLKGVTVLHNERATTKNS